MVIDDSDDEVSDISRIKDKACNDSLTVISSKYCRKILIYMYMAAR
jgi:hypothetical protein